MNKQRRSQIISVKNDCEALRVRIAIIHEDEYCFREKLFARGLDESNTADVSDDALDALSKAETAVQTAAMELRKI